MNNEETILKQSNEIGKDASQKNNNTKVAAAAVGGAALGGGASYAANAFASNENNAEEAEPEVQVEEVRVETEVKPQPVSAKPAEETANNSSTTDNNDIEGNHEHDYTGNNGANPVINNNGNTPDNNGGSTPDNNGGSTPINNNGGDDEPEVQVLGVYENEEGAELAFITDGETIAAVLDSDGDGEADVLAVDENHNNQFEDGEIHDISDQHISMEPLEQEYLAQQQQEAEQNETFAYQAQDETDYDNNADVYDA